RARTPHRAQNGLRPISSGAELRLAGARPQLQPVVPLARRSIVHSGGLRVTLLPNVPLLDVRDLRVSFSTPDGVLEAVRGISFSVDRGTVLGLVGESGSGKSVATQSMVGLARGA